MLFITFTNAGERTKWIHFMQKMEKRREIPIFCLLTNIPVSSLKCVVCKAGTPYRSRVTSFLFDSIFSMANGHRARTEKINSLRDNFKNF